MTALTSIRIHPEVAQGAIGSTKYYDYLDERGVVFVRPEGQVCELINLLNHQGEIEDIWYQAYIGHDDEGITEKAIPYSELPEGLPWACLSPVAFRALEVDHHFRWGFFQPTGSDVGSVCFRWRHNKDGKLCWAKEWIAKKNDVLHP